MQINNMLQSNRIVLKLIQCFNDLQISVFGKKKVKETLKTTDRNYNTEFYEM